MPALFVIGFNTRPAGKAPGGHGPLNLSGVAVLSRVQGPHLQLQEQWPHNPGRNTTQKQNPTGRAANEVKPQATLCQLTAEPY